MLTETALALAVAAALEGRHPPGIKCFCRPSAECKGDEFCVRCEDAGCDEDTVEPCRVTGEPCTR